MLSSVKSIIIRMPNWIGDFVMATPILLELREHYKDTHITVMCKRSLACLLQEEKAIDEVIPFDKGGVSIAVKKIRKRKYDLGILLTNSLSSTLAFYRGRVKNRIGFKRWPRALFLNKSVKWPENLEKKHLVETYKDLLRAIDIPLKGFTPRILLTKEERQDHVFHNPVIGINPGAAYGSAKCWPKERFQELAKQLLLYNPTWKIAFFGDSASEAMIEEIIAPLQEKERVMNFCGKTTLRSLAALIANCAAFVSNDSGPMHMAAALKTPLVALFGSTNEVKTGPYQFGTVIHKHVSCSPCYKRVCPIDFRCMKQITCGEVLKEIVKLTRT